MEKTIKILFFDLENTAISADVWTLWGPNIPINMINTPSRVLCFAMAWLTGPVGWFKADADGLGRLWQALDDCDVLVTYNGRKHDVPHLQRALIEAGYGPPSPYKHLDLFPIVKRNLKYPSNKLEYVVDALGIGKKMKTGGYDLWKQVEADDPKAWAKMARYNSRDVDILRKLYKRVLPWIKNHPNHAAMVDRTVCPTCGSPKLQSRGTEIAGMMKYRRFHCQACGAWSRGGKATTLSTPVERRKPI